MDADALARQLVRQLPNHAEGDMGDAHTPANLASEARQALDRLRGAAGTIRGRIGAYKREGGPSGPPSA